MRPPAVGTALALFLGSCTGQVLPSEGGNPSGVDQPSIPGFVPGAAALRRLTTEQYVNSVRDLLGQSVEVPTELEPDTPLNGFVAIGASRTTISPLGVERYETAAFDVAGQAVADATFRQNLVPCTPSGPTDDACTTMFVQSFGRRAFRRPLTDEEVTRYVGVARGAAETLGDFYAGIEFAIAGMLQSPMFLFRVEIGQENPDDPQVRPYSSWEMASRLSYLLWNTTPDDTLLDAAAAGHLTTIEGLREQAQRLLDSPRGHDAVRNFFTEYLALEELEHAAKDPEVFPQLGASFAESAREGTLLTIDDLIRVQDADARDLLTTPITFVNDELATVYGVSAPASGDFERVTLSDEDPRRGLLGQAGILALHAHYNATSVTLRGRFVRQALLCANIPPPPPDVESELPELSGTIRTNRERVQVHLTTPSCATCHRLMDPIGLALENFDAVGAYRETHNGATIDPSGELDGVSFPDARGLAETIRQHPDLVSCLVRQLYRYARGEVETPGEEAVVQHLLEHFVDAGHRLSALIAEIVVSDGFRFAGAPQ